MQGRVSRGPARHSQGESTPGLGVAAGEVLRFQDTAPGLRASQLTFL